MLMPEATVPTPSYRNIDSRQLRQFMKVPGFAQSLTAEQHSGMTRRIMTDRWSSEERIVYDAVEEGYTSLDSLPIATGLTETQVRSALASLTKMGYIKSFGVSNGGSKKEAL